MAVINQLNINLGTEANPNFVLHDINDKRITTTAITTCSHILASNSASLTSIAPITAANLASVLGGGVEIPSDANLNDYKTPRVYRWAGNRTNQPTGTYSSVMVVYSIPNTLLWQILCTNPANYVYIRSYAFNSSTWSSWQRIDNYGTSSLSELASALGEQVPVYQNQTWDSLLVLASQLSVNKPKLVFVNGKIGTYGSSYGSVVILVNRDAWKSVILPNMCSVDGQVSGTTVSNKTGREMNSTSMTF